MKKCVFCKEWRFPFHDEIRRNNSDTMLYQDENIFITADIGPITEGHALIITHQHNTNFMSTEEDVRLSVIKAIDFLCQNVYHSNSFIAFEHGSIENNEAGNSVDHAHIHVTPKPCDLVHAVINDGKFVKMYSIDIERYAKHHEPRPYLAIFQNNKVYFFIINQIPSQYLRFVYAKCISNTSNPNWRLTYMERDLRLVYDNTVLLFADSFQNVNPENETLSRIALDNVSSPDDAIQYAFDQVSKLPFEKCTNDDYCALFDNTYEPGLFYISERKKSPSFLLEENNTSYIHWFIKKVTSEIKQIALDCTFHDPLFEYGLQNVISDIYWIFNHVFADGHTIADQVMNQVYSDFFRRSVMYLITGSPLTICNNHKANNELLERVGINILSKSIHYSLYKILKQSLISGVIGMNLKESLISTAPISLSGTLFVDPCGRSFDIVQRDLNDRVESGQWVGINDYSIFEKVVIMGGHIHLCWITDDYLATMFEMRFIEAIMQANSELIVTIIPRYDSYSNDASYNDILHFLSLTCFDGLRRMYEQERLNVCREGCDLSTFDGTRMSIEMAASLRNCDYVVISGARSYEMAQGINKNAFFTGIAVCKGYTESITGFDRESGALIFVYQPAKTKSFRGFRNRNLHIQQCHGYIVSYADYTTRDYIADRKSESPLDNSQQPSRI